MEFGGSVLIGVAGENVGDLIMDGKKSLHLPWRLEAFHNPLSSSRRLVRVLCPIVEAFMLAVLDAGHDLPLGGSVAAQFVGDQHTRRPQLPFQKLAEQAFGGLRVAPALDQNVENKALLVNRAPEPVLRARDRDDDLIKVPFCRRGGGLADGSGWQIRDRILGPIAGSSRR
jgi:hypothetical protein